MGTETASQASFGDLVRRYRLAAMLSQEALAERAGLSTDAIGLIERGKRGAPRPETVALLARALDLDPDARAALAAAAARVPTSGQATPTARGTVLPSPPLTSFVGREGELASIRARLADPTTRLLTLAGAGGSGKTRLALEVASAVEGDFGDGVVFVDLSPLTDPGLVLPTIARVLGVRETADQPIAEVLHRALKASSRLLVLDNFEQVADAAPDVAALLGACPGVRALATSRVPLHVRGERLWTVPPLAVPTLSPASPLDQLAEVAAVRLFVERVRDAKPEFALSPDNAPTVAEICRRLDGLPLALELAAAWVRVLSPQALLARLGHRLSLLDGGPRDAPARQRTLRATIDWSYALLTDGERALLARLSVFVGGWTLEAAEAVCTPRGDIEVLSTLASLVDKNLVREEGGPEPRFSMLETIREYAGERLIARGEGPATRAEHARYVTALTEELGRGIMALDPVSVERLGRELGNIRGALDWSIREDPTLALRSAAALWWFWWMRSYFAEGRRWLEAALAATREDQADRAVRAKALDGAGLLTMYLGDSARARDLVEEALRLSREIGDTGGIALSLELLGAVAHFEGDFERYARLDEEALQLHREVGDPLAIAWNLDDLGHAVWLRGDLERAGELWEESLRIWRVSASRWAAAIALQSLAAVALRRGEDRRAEDMWRESLRSWHEVGDKDGMARAISGLGAVAGFRQDHARAVELIGAAEALWTSIGMSPLPMARQMMEDVSHAARTALDTEAYDAAWKEGQVMGIEQAVTYALGEDVAAAFLLYPDTET